MSAFADITAYHIYSWDRGIYLTPPFVAKPGERLRVLPSLHNAGDARGSLWIRNVDVDTGVVIASYRTIMDPSGRESFDLPKELVMPNRTLHLRLEAGHDEAVDDKEEFTISVPAPPVEWLPIAIGAFSPIIFGLAVIGYTELTKKK
jgi:hypothetical protein